MARPLRIEFENAYYHVMNRGTERRATFTKDEHRETFLKLLAETSAMFGIEILAYCLMGNHYHLLLRTPFANLSRAMRHIDGVYTQRFNRLEKRDGPLFRGRYRAIVVEEDRYLVAVSRYIHRNPAEAKLVENLSDYPWSSYPSYVEVALKPEWLSTHDVLDRMGIIGADKGQSYRSFVESVSVASLEKYYASGRVSPILGGKSFRSLVMHRATWTNHPEIPHSRTLRSHVSVDAVIEEAVSVFNSSRAHLTQSRRGQANLERSIVMYVARRKFGNRLQDIADALGCSSYSVVGSAITRLEKTIEKQPLLIEQANQLERGVRNRLC